MLYLCFDRRSFMRRRYTMISKNSLSEYKIFFTKQQKISINICYNQVCFMVFNYRIKFQPIAFQYIKKILSPPLHSYFIVFSIVIHSYLAELILYQNKLIRINKISDFIRTAVMLNLFQHHNNSESIRNKKSGYCLGC
jgi:hypothetical protein